MKNTIITKQSPKTETNHALTIGGLLFMGISAAVFSGSSMGTIATSLLAVAVTAGLIITCGKPKKALAVTKPEIVVQEAAQSIENVDSLEVEMNPKAILFARAKQAATIAQESFPAIKAEEGIVVIPAEGQITNLVANRLRTNKA